MRTFSHPVNVRRQVTRQNQHAQGVSEWMGSLLRENVVKKLQLTQIWRGAGREKSGRNHQEWEETLTKIVRHTIGDRSAQTGPCSGGR